jgi:hypothetical protein
MTFFARFEVCASVRSVMTDASVDAAFHTVVRRYPFLRLRLALIAEVARMRTDGIPPATLLAMGAACGFTSGYGCGWGSRH